jgi:uncharacterized protein (DUF362 family)
MSASEMPNPEPRDAMFGRREFLRRMAVLGAAALAVPVLAACGDEPAPTAPSAPPTATSAAAPSTATPPPPAITQAATATTVPSPAPVESTATTTPEPAQAQAAATGGYPDITQPTPSPSPAEPIATKAPPTPATKEATPPPVASRPLEASGVALLRTTDRVSGVPAVLGMLGFAPGWLRGKQVVLKANFNSADPPPGSTSMDTLKALVQQLQAWGAAGITLIERSGMGDTRQVLSQRGVLALARKLDVKVVVLDELKASEWVKLKGAHWRRGFLFPRVVQEADVVVQTCCLKTHRFGGHFTMSLKNSVGMVAKYDPADGYNYMSELHSSPDQRRMIAEINAAYKPALILLDGIIAFVNGGPEQGKTAQAGVLLAGRDRIAIDAAGVAMLRHLGTTEEVSQGAVFGLAQIARAVQLGLGAASATAVALHPAPDSASQELAAIIARQLVS